MERKDQREPALQTAEGRTEKSLEGGRASGVAGTGRQSLGRVLRVELREAAGGLSWGFIPE